MTFNTGNPIGSTDARDRSDNSENLDLAVNSLSQTFVDRLGITRDTLEGVYQKSAYYRAGTFDAGYTLTNNRQTLAYGNVEYSWSGAFPKVVPAGSTPSTAGGVGVGAWSDKTDLMLRSELSNGALLLRNYLWSLRDFVSVKDFGAVGDGVTDDTEAINFCLTQCVGTEIFFPAGVYKYSGGGVLGDGTTIRGAGRTNTVILTPIPNPTFLFNCAGFGSGIENIKITTSVTQTSGSWVLLSGIESYISNFYMNFDFNGILMTGVAARIRHGRMQDGAVGAIRIRAEGGDTSQCIDDVIMGAQTPANISQAGIRVRNSSALMITNTSIIQQGVGLLIDPASPADNVFSLYVSKCFFDNGTYGIKVAPTGGAGLYRSRFTDVWASSSSNDGVYLNSGTSNTISGVYFESCHCVLNAGSGFTTGTGCADISIRGGLYAQNTFGMYINAVLKLKITEATIGMGGGLLANSSSGIVLTAVTDQFLISDNIIVGNPSAIVDESTGIFRHISRNIGFITSTTGTATILAGNTTVVVNHGLNSTPLLSEITLTRGTGNAGSTDLYADSVTASQFTIHTALAPSSNMTIYFTIRTKGS